jgi:hypothetical protein
VIDHSDNSEENLRDWRAAECQHYRSRSQSRRCYPCRSGAAYHSSLARFRSSRTASGGKPVCSRASWRWSSTRCCAPSGRCRRKASTRHFADKTISDPMSRQILRNLTKQIIKSLHVYKPTSDIPCWHFGNRACEQHVRPIQCEPRSIDMTVLFIHVQKST